MSARPRAGRAVDGVGLRVVGVVEECDVDLHRRGRFWWQLVFGKIAQNLLAADDDDAWIVDDARSGTEDVLQLLAFHAAWSVFQWVRNEVSAACRSSLVRTPAKGLFCRSSIAQRAREVRASNTASGPASSSSCQSAAGDALHVHGGIGFTWEHPSHVFLKRARARFSLFGSPARQLDSLASHLFAAPA